MRYSSFRGSFGLITTCAGSRDPTPNRDDRKELARALWNQNEERSAPRLAGEPQTAQSAWRREQQEPRERAEPCRRDSGAAARRAAHGAARRRSGRRHHRVAATYRVAIAFVG